MFLYDPEQYIEWLGYPSAGDFWCSVFCSPLLNEVKLHAPCAKTLRKYLASNPPIKITPQAEKFFHRLKKHLVSLGINAEYFEESSEPVLRVQLSIRVKWPDLFKGMEISRFYPQAYTQASSLLGKLQELLDSLDGLDNKERSQQIIENDWVISSLTELGVESIINRYDASIAIEDNPTMAKVLHYLNIYMFIKTFAAFDADFNSSMPMEHKQSIFNKLMPSYPLYKWEPHRSGLFEPLLARFPSKLIGYRAFSKYAGCNEESIATSLRQFYARKRNLKFKTVREWLRGALEELAKTEDFDVEEVIHYCEPVWWVADILSGWIHVTGDQELDHEVVTCFSHYNRFYNEAIGSREP